ncbi:HAMP domain-containing histidine kinase [Rhizobium sp. WYCCWR 11290]|uniref:histidine kinase n=1 Tax=Rhizobium changzhiense TaxID=2692317 RepID=A0A7Z0RGZ3_9HYPH|nr:HAMP domain-containing sensor histidine kinase [Rhizobium changzhiense]NZD60144.1 HAMP domain-containing histidine kinase [Rhizobium changzhiense]
MLRSLTIPSRQNASVFLCCLFGAIFATAGICSAQVAGRVPRVLILYPYDERIPATNIVGESTRVRLLEATAGKIDLFSEFLDLSRFPETPHVDRMARYLAEKYIDRRPDLVIALGKESTSFIVENRNAIAPNAKIVFGGFGSATANELHLPDDVVGALTEFEIRKTAEMAIGLQPNARQLVVIAGSAEFDKAWIDSAQEDLTGLPPNIQTTYLTGLSIDEFVERATALPPDTIIIVLTVLRDRTGRNFVPLNSLERIASAASAPVYGPYSTYLGHGIVGGNAATFESTGAAVASLAIDALAGRAITDVTVPQSYIADARQLQRWRLSEADLPLGTVVSFRERSLWEEYWKEIVAISVFVAAQSLVIVWLVFERRRRTAAELQARRRLLEVIHLNQSATAGALSASIAHELNQPLGAIRINAETAAIMLESKQPDLKLIQQILADIRDDDQRAGDIIDRMRGLLKKRSEVDWQEFDLNDVVRSVIHILHPEALRRNVVVSSVSSTQGLPVRADRVHVQQVILNLATNAMDAMLNASAAERNLVIQTAVTETNEKVEVSISDTGSGIPTDKLSSIFDAFYTTKPAGTGLGLSIARVIIEIYGGKIWADNRPEGGAVFRFVLPLAQYG